MKHSIGIVGNGFVGSAVASGFSLHSSVRIFDVDSSKSTHSLEETVNLSDFVFVSVPTPMRGALGGAIDPSIMYEVFDNISEINKRDDNLYLKPNEEVSKHEPKHTLENRCKLQKCHLG